MNPFSRVLFSGPARALTRQFKRGRLTVFMLHRAAGVYSGIGGHDADRLGPILEQMRRRGIRFISLADVADAVEGRREIIGDSVAFTIDDGYRDQAEILAPLFLKREIPLTLFVITGLLDGLLWPWDAKISWLVRQTSMKSLQLKLGSAVLRLPTDTRQRKSATKNELVQIFSGLESERLPHALTALQDVAEVQLPIIPPDEFEPVAWSSLKQLERDGLSVAPHTVTHRIVSRLPVEQVRWELAESMARLRSELTSPLPILAWPVGRNRHYGLRDLDLAAEANLRISFSADGGYTDVQKARHSGRSRQMLSRYAWTDSLPLALRYATGVEAVRETFLPLPAVSRLPGWLTETSRIEPRSMRQWAETGFSRAIRKGRDLALLRTDSIRNAAAIRAQEIDRLVFVCKGNICRSSFAEAVARSKGWPAESFGLDVKKSQSADEEANKVALMLGVDMTDHGSRSIRQAVFSPGDCLVAMEPEQLVALQDMKARHGCQVTLLGIWGASADLRVTDPYGKGRREMVRVFGQIEDSLSGLLRTIEHGRHQPRELDWIRSEVRPGGPGGRRLPEDSGDRS